MEERVRTLVADQRRHDPSPDEPLRGLYLSDEHIDLILAGRTPAGVADWSDGPTVSAIEVEADRFEAGDAIIRLRAMVQRAGLDQTDLDLLLVALAPDLDPRFERLYGYLNDDVTRRRASIALALTLAGASPWSAAARDRLSPDGPLVACGLVLIEERDRPYLSRSLRVPDRVAAHLLGGDHPDAAIAGLLAVPARASPDRLAASLAGVLRDGVRLTYLMEKVGASAPQVAAAAFELAGRPAVILDLRRLGPHDDGVEVARLARREGLLEGAGVIAGPIDDLAERDPTALRALAESGPAQHNHGEKEGPGGTVPLVLYGRRGWEPGWSRLVPVTTTVEAGPAAARADLWTTHLAATAPREGDAARVDVVDVTAPDVTVPDVAVPDVAVPDVTVQLLLSPDEIGRAVTSARLQARLDGQPVQPDHLRAGALSQNGAGLERLARRIRPQVTWDDLVLARPTEQALRDLAGRARQRGQVLDAWGMRPGGGRGRGVTALFAGDSGTGKTMSAEVVAGDLGLDLYTVNLATVVDKYVGETEKNLERIFVEADGVNGVLLFDEADALFGKRSEVRDSNDRYANIEVAYLLQRMETFDGIAILATNLGANVDEAFARRLDLIIDFPAPDVELRSALWDRCLGPGLPRGDDLDLDFCARSFELSGGNIRSVAITAAYLAAATGQKVTMLELVRAIQQEYRKLGRLVVPSEFGPYYPLVGT